MQRSYLNTRETEDQGAYLRCLKRLTAKETMDGTNIKDSKMIKITYSGNDIS